MAVFALIAAIQHSTARRSVSASGPLRVCKREASSEVTMKRIDVVKRPDGWAGTSGGRTVPNTKATTKAEAVKKTAAAAKKSSEPVSVRIHKTDGRIQEERTYPRAADPRSSKG
jgi:hypothetical protein